MGEVIRACPKATSIRSAWSSFAAGMAWPRSRGGAAGRDDARDRHSRTAFPRRECLSEGRGRPAGSSSSPTNESRKAGELAENPRAALILYWSRSGGRSVTGPVRASRRGVRGVFPLPASGSRLAAWASRQSMSSTNAVLEDEYRRLETGVRREDVPLPPFWGGYRVAPESSSSGWAARTASTTGSGTPGRTRVEWVIERLAPKGFGHERRVRTRHLRRPHRRPLRPVGRGRRASAPGTDDAVAFIAELAGGPRARAAIGTGRIALPLAANGIEVDGIHLLPSRWRQPPRRSRAAPPSLSTLGDIADVRSTVRTASIYVVFNSLYTLPTQEAQARCFRNVRGAIWSTAVRSCRCVHAGPSPLSTGSSRRRRGDPGRQGVAECRPARPRPNGWSRTHVVLTSRPGCFRFVCATRGRASST